jgi:hypothetical protein
MTFIIHIILVFYIFILYQICLKITKSKHVPRCNVTNYLIIIIIISCVDGVLKYYLLTELPLFIEVHACK